MAGMTQDFDFELKANLHGYAPNLPRASASFLTIWNIETCSPRAFVATTGFNDHRTAAGFAAAARALNGAKARTLTVFGAGKIAGPAIQYIAEVSPIERVHIVARRPDRAQALAETMRRAPSMKDIEVSASLPREEAARAADIIVTVTTSDTPVLLGEWVKSGTLVILGGANRPHAREADDDLITRAAIFVDHTDGCIEKAGDIRLPIQSNLLSRAQIAGEIGSVLSGHLKFAMPADKIIVFKSIGLISQDMVLAEALQNRGTGKRRRLLRYSGRSIRLAREAVLV